MRLRLTSKILCCILTIAMLLSLLAACEDTSKTTDTPTSPVQSPTTSPDRNENDEKPSNSPNGGAFQIDGYPTKMLDTGAYYVEGTALESNPGDNITTTEGAEIAWSVLKEISDLLSLAEGRNIYIWLRGIESIGDEESYVYGIELDSGDREGKNNMPLYNVAVSYNGFVYRNMDNEGWEHIYTTGRGDLFDPDQGGGPGNGGDNAFQDGDYNWWGSYLNEQENKVLNINNFDGQSFAFSFIAFNGDPFEGVAVVEDNLAYYMDLEFDIAESSEYIIVSLFENRNDSAEREEFVDVYYRNYND